MAGQIQLPIPQPQINFRLETCDSRISADRFRLRWKFDEIETDLSFCFWLRSDLVTHFALLLIPASCCRMKNHADMDGNLPNLTPWILFQDLPKLG